ncbi:MAG: type II toxin-antitoxin system Phd/YefM family antitoxin [Methylococcales bacterium]
MNTITVNKFRGNLKNFVEQVITEHQPLKITRRGGEDFVVLSADDWEREQETLFILQNNDLLKQIQTSAISHKNNKGYKPAVEELDEITGI